MSLDSYRYLTDERFAGEVEAVLERAEEAGVEAVVSIASDEPDAQAVAELTERHPRVWGTAGIHPHVAAGARPGDLERLADLLRSRRRLVAVGETGLDYHYDNSPRKVQRRRFREQVELAAEMELPVVVHSRDADDDTRALIREMGREVRGVLHCFTGGTALLEEALEAGWYVSYSGIASFSSFDGEAGLRLAPPDRLLVETDAPYLAPDPHRGKRNEPAFVPYVAAAVA
jgi:TatD DNase family protein